jgi:hypothetical protein
MKRKQSSKLTPCEEKALVTLQAQQIKEKEARAKKRAKKAKEKNVILGPQVLPYQDVKAAPMEIPQYQSQPISFGLTPFQRDLQSIGINFGNTLMNYAFMQSGRWNERSTVKPKEKSTQQTPPPTGPKVGSGKSKKKSAQMDIQILDDEDKISRFRRTGQYIPKAPPSPGVPDDPIAPDLIPIIPKNEPFQPLTNDEILKLMEMNDKLYADPTKAEQFRALINYNDTLLKENMAYKMPQEEAKKHYLETTANNTNENRISYDTDGRRFVTNGRVKTYEDGSKGLSLVPLDSIQPEEEKRKGKLARVLANISKRPFASDNTSLRTAFNKIREFRPENEEKGDFSEFDVQWPEIPPEIPQAPGNIPEPTGPSKGFVSRNRLPPSSLLSSSPQDELKMMKNIQDFFPPLPDTFTPVRPIKTEPQQELPQQETPRTLIREFLQTVPNELKDSFYQQYGYELDMHDTLKSYHLLHPYHKDPREVVGASFSPEDTENFLQQYRRWKAVNVASDPNDQDNFFSDLDARINQMSNQSKNEREAAKAYIRNIGLASPSPSAPPNPPVSNAQSLLTPPALKQYPGFSAGNIATPFRKGGLLMSPSPDSLFNYTAPTQAALRTQAAINRQFYKKNELFEQKYDIPTEKNPANYNMYSLKLQSILKTHFPTGQNYRSVRFKDHQLKEINNSTNYENLHDTVDYFLSQNYPKRNQRPIPTSSINESIELQSLQPQTPKPPRMQSLEIEEPQPAQPEEPMDQLPEGLEGNYSEYGSVFNEGGGFLD